jgi:hypothetical protein
MEDVNVEPGFGEILKHKEEREERKRLVRKVASEVGYLYFVGIDGLAIWREDFDRSDQYLVERNRAPSYETTGDEHVQDEDEANEEDWDDVMDVDVDEMDVDNA